MNFCMLVRLLVLSEDASGISMYATPAVDMQFKYFTITDAIPKNGTNTGADESLQRPVQINNSVIFEFQGFGNAYILFQRNTPEDLNDVFLVEIGGGTKYSRVGVYRYSNINVLNQPAINVTMVPNVTSVSEYRFFWIGWIADKKSIFVGTGQQIFENEIIFAYTLDVKPLVYLDQITIVSISTMTTITLTPKEIASAIHTTEMPTFPVTNLVKRSTTEHSATIYTRRTKRRNNISYTEGYASQQTNQETAHVLTSINIASTTTSYSSTELMAATYTVIEHGFLHTVNVSNISDAHSTSFILSDYLTAGLSTHLGVEVNKEIFFDKSGNVAAIGVVGSVIGVGAMGMAGYLLKIRCMTIVNKTRGG